MSASSARAQWMACRNCPSWASYRRPAVRWCRPLCALCSIILACRRSLRAPRHGSKSRKIPPPRPCQPSRWTSVPEPWPSPIRLARQTGVDEGVRGRGSEGPPSHAQSGCCALIPELFVDDAFEGFVAPEVCNIAHETIDIPSGAILAGTGSMRGHHDIVHIPQRTIGRQGLPWRHVERGTANLLALDRSDQGVFDDHLTARDVDEQRARLHVGKRRVVEQALRL